MSHSIVSARNLSKRYGKFQALDDINLNLNRGNVIGLIGPNGAGKTTLLKTIMGLQSYEGELDVVGLPPFHQRNQLMERVCFVSDVGMLPEWATVKQLLSLCKRIHPKFNADKVQTLLAQTEISQAKKISTLSKGMKAQVHLAIALAIEVELLILDEPTLGLDILHRKQFQENLQNHYFNEERTIIITTHQVEEIENILSHLVFIQHGKICLDVSMDDFSQQFHELEIKAEDFAAADELQPIYKRRILDKDIFMFEKQDPLLLAKFGEIHKPSIADVFVAKVLNESAQT